MGEFILWLLVTLLFTGGVTVCGYKTKEAWDKWHHVNTAVQTTIGQQTIAGDLEEGNKTVIDKYINIAGTSSLSAESLNVDVAKLKIGRAFEDFNKVFDETVDGFPKESDLLAAQYSGRGLGRSSMHINAQKELSVKTKKNIDKAIEELQRKIEDVLVDLLGKTSLRLAGVAFVDEQKQFEEVKNKCLGIYPLLNNTPKNWEQRALGKTGLTKDFDVANVGKDKSPK